MISTDPPAEVAEALSRLGRNIRTARLRRQMTQASMAVRLGASRYVVADVEQGKPTTGIAVYLGALWVLGLLEEFGSVGDPALDEEGILLQRLREPRRARPRTADDDF